MIKLTGNEHLLDAVFEYCEDIITVKDLNLRYVAYNKAFLKHIGIEDGNKILGKTVQEVVPQSGCDIILQNVKKSYDGIETLQLHIRSRKRRGTKIR